jgi:hypothetical protein
MHSIVGRRGAADRFQPGAMSAHGQFEVLVGITRSFSGFGSVQIIERVFDQPLIVAKLGRGCFELLPGR